MCFVKICTHFRFGTGPQHFGLCWRVEEVLAQTSQTRDLKTPDFAITEKWQLVLPNFPKAMRLFRRKGLIAPPTSLETQSWFVCLPFAASNDFHSVVYVFKISQYLLTASQSGKMQSLHFLFCLLYPSLSGYFIHLLPQSTVSQDLYSK